MTTRQAAAPPGGPATETIWAATATSPTIVAGAANALVYWDSTPLVFRGGSGTSTVYASGSATIVGGTGRVTAAGANGVALLWAGDAGYNNLTGGTGQSTLFGSANGTLVSGGGSTLIWAGGGSNVIEGVDVGRTLVVLHDGVEDVVQLGGGDDTIFGGAGTATVSALTAAGAREVVVGGSGAMQVRTGAGADAAWGGSGQMVVYATGGGDGQVFGGGTGSFDLQLADAPNATVVGGSQTTIEVGVALQAVVFGGADTAGTTSIVQNVAWNASAPAPVSGEMTVVGQAGTTVLNAETGRFVVFGTTGPLDVINAKAAFVTLVAAGTGATAVEMGDPVLEGASSTTAYEEAGAGPVTYKFDTYADFQPPGVHIADIVGFRPGIDFLSGSSPTFGWGQDDVVPTIVANQVSGGGSTTITLPNGSTVSFVGTPLVDASFFRV